MCSLCSDIHLIDNIGLAVLLYAEENTFGDAKGSARTYPWGGVFAPLLGSGAAIK
jgi:hypothetical protein